MWKTLGSTLLEILDSKKAMVALLTAVAGIAAKKGYDVDTTTILALMTPAMVYIGAQGWADQGKPAAEAQLAAVTVAAKTSTADADRLAAVKP